MQFQYIIKKLSEKNGDFETRNGFTKGLYKQLMNK